MLKEKSRIQKKISHIHNFNFNFNTIEQTTEIISEINKRSVTMKRAYYTVSFTTFIDNSQFTMGCWTNCSKSLLAFIKEIYPSIRKSVETERAETIEPGFYPVIFSPSAGAFLIHEIFGHLFEADSIVGNELFLNRHKHSFNPELNIVDDGNLDLPFTYYLPYDDEGIPAKKTYLIKNGKINSLLHNVQTAKTTNLESTGNGRVVDFQYTPIVRMTNTYLEPGKWTVKEMLEGIERGLYIEEISSAHTDDSTVFLRAGRAYIINNMKIKGAVKNITIVDNPVSILKAIDKIGNQLEWLPGQMCGKENQNGLPVGMGCSYLTIEKVFVGGSEDVFQPDF
jgi:TldD protein